MRVHGLQPMAVRPIEQPLVVQLICGIIQPDLQTLIIFRLSHFFDDFDFLCAKIVSFNLSLPILGLHGTPFFQVLEIWRLILCIAGLQKNSGEFRIFELSNKFQVIWRIRELVTATPSHSQTWLLEYALVMFSDS